jgi:hypothetical protein
VELHAGKEKILVVSDVSHAAGCRGFTDSGAEFSYRAIYLLPFLGSYAVAWNFGFLS